jgi:hypothetical protein
MGMHRPALKDFPTGKDAAKHMFLSVDCRQLEGTAIPAMSTRGQCQRGLIFEEVHPPLAFLLGRKDQYLLNGLTLDFPIT